MTILSILFVVLALFLGIVAFTFVEVFHVLEPRVDANEEICVKATDAGIFEDQTKYNDNSLLASRWDFLYPPSKHLPGGIHVASGFRSGAGAGSLREFVDDRLRVEELPIDGFPEGVDFHPHGIYVHRPSGTVYAINHAYERGGERIEVFSVSTAKDGDDDPDNDVPNRLRYVRSITSDWMAKELDGILNSLVVVEPNKFYVSQWQDSPQDREGGDLLVALKFIAKVLAPELHKATLFRWMYPDSVPPRDTLVWYCEYDVASSALDCRKAAEGFGAANGMTHNEDYSKIFVADSLHHAISVFDRDAATNELSGRIDVEAHSCCDNLKTDDVTGRVYGAGFHGPTSVVTELSERRTGEWRAKRVLTTSKLESASNGLRMGNYVVVGSFAKEGLAVCSMPDMEGRNNKAGTLPETSEL